MTDTALSENARRLAQVVDDILNLPNQVWLLGAGISLRSGIPLMYSLTNRVKAILQDEDDCAVLGDRAMSSELFEEISKVLRTDHHVEHILSYLGDLISLAGQQRHPSIAVGSKSYTIEQLNQSHRHIQLAIRYTIEFGYHAPVGDNTEKIGKLGQPVITSKYHDSFAEALFSRRRAGQESRPPVRFVTTNYDTLLEDALSKARIGCVDGFSGGATGFWDPNNADERLRQAQSVCRHTATVCKLHGSIDWIADEEGIVTRVRSAAIDALDPHQSLLIYPQATKYQVTQRDPFASLFSEFRRLLNRSGPTLLAICGYSFGDEHINEEIARALKSSAKGLTLVVFAGEVNYSNADTAIKQAGLPLSLGKWLSDPTMAERIHVMGEKGIYRGGLTNLAPTKGSYRWWTFDGVIDFLREGAEVFG